MKIAVRYCSRTGNTRKLAAAVASAAGVKAQEVTVPLKEKADILFLGSAVYAAGIDDSIKKFLADNKDKIGKIYNFSTAAVISSTYKQVSKLAQENGIKMAEKEFHCRGAFSMLHKNRPNAQDLQNVEKFVLEVLAEEKR